jgi:release factor glutamine methyltransferase
MNLAQALAAAAALGLTRLDAQLLLLHALGRDAGDRAWLLAHDTDSLAEPAVAAFFGFCERRAGAEPLAYIVGRKEFFGLDLKVDARVLVPRPDTETLVEWALEILDCHARPLGCHPGPLGCHPGLDPGSTSRAAWIADQVRNDNLAPRVIDLGTGSGAIALAIKKHRPGAFVEAVDVSAEALEVATGNARSLSLEVEFRRASWLAGARSRYDLILSNPPYIASGDAHLAALRHEPVRALEAGPDGLREIRTIAAQAPGRLRDGGWLLLEHGWDQAAPVRALLEAAGFDSVQSRCDLAGIERCSGGKWLETGIIERNV